MPAFDFVVIGAGIAGASAASELAALGRTLLLEAEPLPGQHATGRSAAVLTGSYGADPIRRLTEASRPFLASPPDGFADGPLLSPRPVLWLARPEQLPRLDALQAAGVGSGIERIDAAATCALCPLLRPERVGGALLEPGAMDIDVAALLQGFLRRFRQRGGRLCTRARVVALTRSDGVWRVTPERGDPVSGAVVVNAAGAWGDAVARLAGVAPAGLTANRRTAFMVDLPAGVDAESWPAVIDCEEQFYFKPESGGLLASPADETPDHPGDAQPETLDIARAIDRIQRATRLRITRPRRSWAGLRTFAPDRVPVLGMDPDHPGFFWLAGQGGYGIMTSPAMARATAARVAGEAWPADLGAGGVDPAALAPGRLRADAVRAGGRT